MRPGLWVQEFYRRHRKTAPILLAIIALVCVTAAQGADEVGNVQEFHALCRIFNLAHLASTPATLETFQKQLPLEKVAAAYREVAGMAAKLGSADQSPVELDLSFGTIKLKTRARLQEARAVVGVAMGKLSKLNESVVAERETAIKAAQNALELMSEHIAPAAEKGKLSSIGSGAAFAGGVSFAETCKSHTNAGHAGKTIAHDLMCLCSWQHSAAANMCGFASGSGTAWTGATSGQYGGTHWDPIYKACKLDPQPVKISKSEVVKAVGEFDRLLGVQGDKMTTKNQARWILGKAATGGCDGGNSDFGTNGGICVDYGAGGYAARGTILWRENFLEAVTKLTLYEEGKRRVERLLDQAEAIVAITEIRIAELANSTDEDTGHIGDHRTQNQKITSATDPQNPTVSANQSNNDGKVGAWRFTKTVLLLQKVFLE